jgi:hypothetical protein
MLKNLIIRQRRERRFNTVYVCIHREYFCIKRKQNLFFFPDNNSCLFFKKIKIFAENCHFSLFSCRWKSHTRFGIWAGMYIAFLFYDDSNQNHVYLIFALLLLYWKAEFLLWKTSDFVLRYKSQNKFIFNTEFCMSSKNKFQTSSKFSFYLQFSFFYFGTKNTINNFIESAWENKYNFLVFEFFW